MPTIDVAAGLIFHQGRLLIAQRFPEAHLGGLWEFPGGKVEPNETFGGCLRREIGEELGIEVKVLEEVADLVHDYSEKSVHLRFFRCALLSGDPQAIGCAAFAWIQPADLSIYEFPLADREIVSLLELHPHWWTCV